MSNMTPLEASRVRPIRLAYLRGANPAPGRADSASGVRPSPRSADEFWLLARWSRSADSLRFHAETLISWAPIEMLGLPVAVEDEAGELWMLCKFRYFGPYADRDRLVASARSELERLAHWEEVNAAGLD